jgi:hypothetical protein
MVAAVAASRGARGWVTSKNDVYGATGVRRVGGRHVDVLAIDRRCIIARGAATVFVFGWRIEAVDVC